MWIRHGKYRVMGVGALMLAGCAQRSSSPPTTPSAAGQPAHTDISESVTGVTFEPVAPGVWLHRSVEHVPEFGSVSSNGLIVRTDAGALLVDTAWTPAQTAEVLDWAEAHVGAVHAVLVTHWHADRTGGLPEVQRRGIISYGGQRTVELARTHNAPVPARVIEDVFDLRTLGVDGETYFPGAGHSLDNLVVWLSEPKLLFGGCLVKSAQAENLGNTADADVPAWPNSLLGVESRYSDLVLVVPGHGAPGGLELLGHTRALLTEHPG